VPPRNGCARSGSPPSSAVSEKARPFACNSASVSATPVWLTAPSTGQHTTRSPGATGRAFALSDRVKKALKSG